MNIWKHPFLPWGIPLLLPFLSCCQLSVMFHFFLLFTYFFRYAYPFCFAVYTTLLGPGQYTYQLSSSHRFAHIYLQTNIYKQKTKTNVFAYFGTFYFSELRKLFCSDFPVRSKHYSSGLISQNLPWSPLALSTKVCVFKLASKHI